MTRPRPRPEEPDPVGGRPGGSGMVNMDDLDAQYAMTRDGFVNRHPMRLAHETPEQTLARVARENTVITALLDTPDPYRLIQEGLLTPEEWDAMRWRPGFWERVEQQSAAHATLVNIGAMKVLQECLKSDDPKIRVRAAAQLTVAYSSHSLHRTREARTVSLKRSTNGDDAERRRFLAIHQANQAAAAPDPEVPPPADDDDDEPGDAEAQA